MSTGFLKMVLAAALLAGCSEQPDGQGTPPLPPTAVDTAAETAEPPPAIPIAAQTDIASHEANGVAILGAPTPRIFATGGTGGVEVYDLSGRRVQQVASGGELKGLDLLPPRQPGAPPLLIGLDVHTPALVAFAVEGDGTLTRMDIAGADLHGAYEGLCAYRSPVDGEAWVFLVMGSGQVEQWWLRPDPRGGLGARKVRNLNLASEVAFCAADASGQSLYLAEKEVGIWRFNAEAESETVPQLVDVVDFGAIAGEVGGLAVYRDPRGTALLVASNASADLIHLYDINAEHSLLGAVALRGEGDIDSVNEAGGLAVTPQSLGDEFPQGLLVAMDNDAGAGATNYKLVSWAEVDAALGLAERAVRNTAPPVTFASVQPVLETDPVATPGDAADDPAVWVHPADPARSTLMGTNKQGGLYIYDLAGRAIQYLEDGQLNNVDVRYGFTLGGETVDLVTASNRSTRSIAIYRVDPESGLLTDVADGLQATGLAEPYGQCMYQHPVTRDTYVFINDKSGLYRQWQLLDAGNGRVRAQQVREFSVPSQPEGCVADDEYGALYVGEEDAALWKFSAEPDGGSAGEVLVRIVDNPALKDDIEGLGLYHGAEGDGYIIVSSQGNDSYAVFERRPGHGYLGSFAVTANGDLAIDGASETDGLEVISTPLGSRFPSGIFIAQDGRNLMPAENQNYKVVPWSAIAAALGLDTHTGWNPRRAVDRRRQLTE